MRILSLFDGMSCGMLALRGAGILVESYDAYEIDKYAIQVSQHNFPEIRQHGDVFEADFTQYEGVDAVIGGSPCTYWSIAKSQGSRETEAHGIGWNLFQQYARAVREAKPRFFIYENNKSMSDAIRREISSTFGFSPICINSALVSAQRRERLYWVGIRQEDGTYRKADVEQPEDRGILLKDVIDGMTDREKGRAVIGSTGRTTTREYFTKQQGNMVYEPIRVGTLPDGKGELTGAQALRIYSPEGKSVCIGANGGGMGAKTGLYALETDCLNSKDFDNKQPSLQDRIYSADAKATAVTTGSHPSYVTDEVVEEEGEPMRIINATKQGYVDVKAGEMVDLQYPHSITRRGRLMVDKSNNMQTSNEWYVYYGTKEFPLYEVKDGKITIKGKEYPIKLKDGKYIIRKLTVEECKRLQTVPDWYDMSCISDTQAYKCLGNGWTVDVIAHLFRSAIDSINNPPKKKKLDDYIEERFRRRSDAQKGDRGCCWIRYVHAQGYVPVARRMV